MFGVSLAGYFTRSRDDGAVVYMLMGLGGFGMIMPKPREGFEADTLNDFKSLNQRSPWLAFWIKGR